MFLHRHMRRRVTGCCRRRPPQSSEEKGNGGVAAVDQSNYRRRRGGCRRGEFRSTTSMIRNLRSRSRSGLVLSQKQGHPMLVILDMSAFLGRRFSFIQRFTVAISRHLYPQLSTNVSSQHLLILGELCIRISWGSTMFKVFNRRLQRDLKKIVDTRIAASNAQFAGTIKAGIDIISHVWCLLLALMIFYFCLQSHPLEVNVVSYPIQRYAVWFGGSVLASTPEFYEDKSDLQNELQSDMV